jgi:PAS domain S-box-containing protein
MLSTASFAVPILLVAFAILVWKASPNRRLNRRFTAYTLVAALWATAVTAVHAGTYPKFWMPISFAAGSLIPVTFLAFMHEYAPLGRGRARYLLRILLIVWAVTGIAFSALSLTTNLVVSAPSISGSIVSRQPGPLYPVFAVFVVATWTTAIAVFALKWRVARGRSRAELQFVAAGMIVPGIAGIVTNLILPWITGRSAYGAIGPYFALSFVAIIGHALIRRRMTDLRLVLHDSLTLAIATFASLIPAMVLLELFGSRLFGHLVGLELAVVLITIAAVILIAPPTRDIARRLLDRYVYRTRANYQRTVREASRALTRMLDLKRLLAFISTTVVEATGVEGVAIYLLDEDGFRLALARRRTEASAFTAPETAPASVPAALGRVQDAVVADEVAREIVNDEDRVLNDDLTASDWALLLPVISDDGLIAFIAVGSKLSGDPFYSQDLDLLMTLANQAGIAIKNARLYAQVVLANEYIENIVATIESGVVAITSAGRIAMFNRAAERLTGRAAEEIKGHPAAQLPPCLGEPLLASAADGTARTLPEIELPGIDRTRPVICTTSPLRDPEGTVLGAVAVFSDLTPLKELEVERRRAERLAYFEVLASGIAHEIKNPLVAIKTFTQLLPRRSSEPQFVSEFGRIVGRAIQRMERVVDRLRTLAHPGRRPEHAIDVRMPLGEALELMQATFEEKRISVGADVGETPCRVLGDHQDLVQLFLNLLMNAHEATPPGGELRVAVTRETEQITVTVADTGPGIAPELLERIFEPFFTTKQRGSGLGLAISAGVAQAHGAKLRAINPPGGGATFVVDFPFAPVNAPVSA